MTFTLKFDEYYRLLALHRALMEAKFCEVPSDLPVSGSPFVAEIAHKVVEALLEWKKAEGGEGSWDEWRRIDASRPEWRIAVLRAAQGESWVKLDSATKAELSRNLLSPFTFDDALLTQFIAAVDREAPPRPVLPENRTGRALEALNAIFVMLRYLAAEEKCSTKMFKILDDAELLPLLMLRGDYGYQRFWETLQEMAERNPKECGLALQRFAAGQAAGASGLDAQVASAVESHMFDSRMFQVWAYSPGHAQLLLRSTKRHDLDKRIDILFTNVATMSLGTVMRGIDEIWVPAGLRAEFASAGEAQQNQRLYKFRGSGADGFVLASTMTVHEDDKMFDEPSEIFPI